MQADPDYSKTRRNCTCGSKEPGTVATAHGGQLVGELVAKAYEIWVRSANAL